MTPSAFQHSHCALGFEPIDVSLYHTAEMPEQRRERFAAHVDACRSCSALLAGQRALDAAVKQLPTYVAPPMRRGEGVAALPRRRMPRWLIATAAAVLAVLSLPLVQSWRVDQLAREAAGADAVWLSASMAGAATLPASSTRIAGLPWLGFLSCDRRIEPVVDGVFLCALLPSGPLGRVGIHAGDVIVAIDRESVHSALDLQRRLLKSAVGDSVWVRFRHGTVTTDASVRLGSRAEGRATPFALEWSPALIAHTERLADDEVDPASIFGVHAVDGRPEFRVFRTVSEADWRATRLLSFFAYPFSVDGLRAGDVIESIDGDRIVDLHAFYEHYGHVGRRAIVIDVRRGQEHRTMHVSPMP